MNREKIRELVIKAITDSNQLTAVVDELFGVQAGNVAESIWSNKNNIIPMAEVSHIEKLNDEYSIKNNQIRIIFKHSKWDDAIQSHEPSVSLTNDATNNFLKCWRIYRLELEGSSYEPELINKV